MDTPLAVDWSQWARDWGTLLTTVVLVGVTGWYAYLTKRLADSAEASAASAREAAEASQAAVWVAESGVDVRLSLSPSYAYMPPREPGSEEPSTVLGGVSVTCEGATIFVHGLTLDRVMVPVKREGVIGIGIRMEEELPEAARSGGGRDRVSLPIRLHRDESIHFNRPSPAPDDPRQIVSMNATVRYSLDGRGSGRPLRVETWGDWHEEN